LAYLLLRMTVGVNIAMHGLSRLLAGPSVFAGSLLPLFRNTPLPAWFVRGFGLGLPWLEAALGLLVLAGLFTRAALTGCALLILVLTFGTTLRQDWAGAGAQLVYAVVFAGLLAFRERDAYGLDELFRKRH
jgi:thiosulfate dehydrogenase [quinone] large subunit